MPGDNQHLAQRGLLWLLLEQAHNKIFMSFQTKHGLNGLSYSYEFTFFQPHPETDGKFSFGVPVVLGYAQLWKINVSAP